LCDLSNNRPFGIVFHRFDRANIATTSAIRTDGFANAFFTPAARPDGSAASTATSGTRAGGVGGFTKTRCCGRGGREGGGDHPEASAPQHISAAYDPIEPVNRTVFRFNTAVDGAVLKPAARSYTKVVPTPARTCVHNFLTNLETPTIFANDLMQLKLRHSLTTLGRFGMNTTVGVAGLFDVATRAGLPRHNADFGQTLGRWGVAAGPALELPIRGPSNVRDTFGAVVDSFFDPFTYLRGPAALDADISVSAAGALDGRSRLLPVTNALEKKPDYYAARRDLQADRRSNVVREARGSEP
jgi:phospholipid-binding lipoprotein MlaA